ncbi:MAG: hypothetical protein R2698_02855 [Microthrixaceae bacterium]
MTVPETVVLTGRPGGTTHRAVELLGELPGAFRLIGGLAVMCRVGTPYRATVDLDAVTRDLAAHHELLATLAVTSSGGGQYTMPNHLDLDVIDIAEESTAELAAMIDLDDVTDLEINVVAHSYAHDSATPLDLTVVDPDGAALVTVRSRLVADCAGSSP